MDFKGTKSIIAQAVLFSIGITLGSALYGIRLITLVNLQILNYLIKRPKSNKTIDKIHNV